MAAQGELGNLGEPPGSLSQTRNGGPGDQKPWRGLDASTRPRALRGDHERGKHARYRGTSDKRRTPRGSGGSRSVAYYRRTWGSEAQATPGRERSETSCCTCRCKSCRRNSPCGAVVISGSPRGDLRAGSPDVQASGGLRTPRVLGLISPGGEQPGGP